MHFRVIVNPHARGGRGAALAARCIARLHALGCAIDPVDVRTFDDARLLSREANLQGADAVVAIGGDGTINQVLNGFYNGQGRRISGARFGVVHVGTSPDFCRSYDIPLDIELACNALAVHRTRRIPVGMIRFEHPAADPGDENNPCMSFSDGTVRYFGCCANIGLGASLARMANGGIRKRLGDTLGTFVSLVQLLRRVDAATYDCIIDGVHQRLSGMCNLSVGLTPYIASGLKVPPSAVNGNGFDRSAGRNDAGGDASGCDTSGGDASGGDADGRNVDDGNADGGNADGGNANGGPAGPGRNSGHTGRFYMIQLRCLSARTVLPALTRLYSGREFPNTDYLTLGKCTNIRIEAVRGCDDVEHDGDPCGRLPCTISMAHDPIDLIW